MTSIRIRRCTVCADVYEYQLSGHGCLDQKVDDRHCSYCLSIIQEAVKNIKVKFECRYESIYDMGKLGLSDLEKRFVGIDAQVLLKWESDWKAEVKSSGKLFVQRVWPGLMNLQTNDFQHIRSIRGPVDPVKGIMFRVSTWDKNPEVKIEVPIEWDLQDNRALGLWTDYPRGIE